MSTTRAPVSIEMEMRQVLAEMEVFASYGTTMNFAPSGGGGDPGRPPGESWPAHLKWRELFDAAEGEERREDVLAKAREALASMFKPPRAEVHDETQQELEQRIVALCRQGWTPDEIALSLRVTPRLVKSTWMRASVVPEDETIEAKKEKVLELAGKHLTERQIAFSTGLPKTTIRRILGRAA